MLLAFNRQRLGMQVNLSTVHIIATTVKNYPASNVNRARVENPWNSDEYKQNVLDIRTKLILNFM